MSKGKSNVHVVPVQTRAGQQFVVKEAGNPTPLTRPSTQAKAIDKAIPIAKQNQSDVVIHGRNGAIRDRDSYGNDPNPPRDKRH
jgi:hypothetical protein